MSDSGYAPSERCATSHRIQLEHGLKPREGLSRHRLHPDAEPYGDTRTIRMASNNGKESCCNNPANGECGTQSSTKCAIFMPNVSLKEIGPHSKLHPFRKEINADKVGILPCSDTHQSLDVGDIKQEQNRLPFGFGGWSPVRNKSDIREQDDIRRKAQVKAYVNWMNSQLKKKPGTRIIEDLKCDMKDGVALVDLVSIIAGQTLEGTYRVPSTTAEKLANIQQVISFMTERRIKMHQMSAKDILDGNLKAIMRLILALAAHYKPNSVKQSSHGTPTKGNTSSMVGMAQSASVVLADARRDMSFAGQRPQKSTHTERPSPGSSHHYSLTPSKQIQRDMTSISPSERSPRSHTCSITGSPCGVTPTRLEFGNLTKSHSQDFRPGGYHYRSQSPEDTSSSLVLSMLEEEHSLMEDDLQQTKSRLLQLQQLLLSGEVDDSSDQDHQVAPLKGPNPAEEALFFPSRLQQTEEILRDVREELSRTRTECMQLQGTKCGLQKRLTEQEKSFEVLKAELLRAGFCQQSLENTKTELEQKLNEKEKIITDLRRELSLREQQLDRYHAEYHCRQQDTDNSRHNLKAQITDLHDKIKRVGETESHLSSKMISQDRKLLKLETKILQSHGASELPSHQTSSRSLQSPCSDDFQLVRESLQSLRSRFPGDDPQHQTIDALEQSISSLMERLNVTEQESRWSDTSSIHHASVLSTGNNKSTLSSLPGLHLHRLDGSTANGHISTKVLYFTDRTVTPFMCSIPKRLGEVTLRDIKNILDRPGNYRYHFKAMDPEFGTVKEEITHDDDVVPGWEGKIVAWIEEDHG